MAKKVNKPRQNPGDGSWCYQVKATVLEEVSLHTIRQYIEVCQQIIFNLIVNRLIFQLLQVLNGPGVQLGYGKCSFGS